MLFRTIPWKRNQLRTKRGSRIFQKLVGFGRTCAPCAALTRRFGRINTPQGALRAPRPLQLRCFLFIPKNTKLTVSRNKMLPFRPELGPSGVYIFPQDHQGFDV
jgi:hypothetical protein